jgi:hypothetical protein
VPTHRSPSAGPSLHRISARPKVPYRASHRPATWDDDSPGRGVRGEPSRWRRRVGTLAGHARLQGSPPRAPARQGPRDRQAPEDRGRATQASAGGRMARDPTHAAPRSRRGPPRAHRARADAGSPAQGGARGPLRAPPSLGRSIRQPRRTRRRARIQRRPRPRRRATRRTWGRNERSSRRSGAPSGRSANPAGTRPAEISRPFGDIVEASSPGSRSPLAAPNDIRQRRCSAGQPPGRIEDPANSVRQHVNSGRAASEEGSR